MMEYLNDNLHALWLTIGFILLIIEVFALGMSSGVLLFAAVGALVTGGAMAIGWLPATWIAGMACFGVSSAVSALLLWKPLLHLQNDDPPGKDTSSDLIGHRFTLEQTLAAQMPASTRYSGVEWRVELDASATEETLQAGTLVEVVSVDSGLFRVVAG